MSRLEDSRCFFFEVCADRALFTDPLTRVGKGKGSYAVPTAGALVGLCKSVYWKPTIEYAIEEFRVMNPIRFESMGMLLPHVYDNEQDMSIFRYLKNVRYLVKARLKFNEARPDLAEDYSVDKHYTILRDSFDVGGRFSPFLGVSECQASVRMIAPCEYENAEGYYDNAGLMRIGIMYKNIDYGSDEHGGRYASGIRLFNCRMNNGVVSIPSDSACAYREYLLKDNKNSFSKGLEYSNEQLEPYEPLQCMLNMYDDVCREEGFIPACHVSIKVGFEIKLTEDGEFAEAYIPEEDDKMTSIPVTEASMVRTGSPAPHFFIDNIDYLGRNEAQYRAYMEQLNNLPDLPKEAEAVRKYLKKHTIVEDLLSVKLPDGNAVELGEGANAPYVRFRVGDKKLWESDSLADYFIGAFISKIADTSVDYLTGEVEKVSVSTNGKIRVRADMAKLISAKDSRGYAYANGTFRSALHSVAPGAESTQKLLAVMRWLIARQGIMIDNSLVFLAWNTHADEDYGNGFGSILMSFREPAYEYTDMHYILLDTASGALRGRLSIEDMGYLKGSAALDNVRSWYESIKGTVWREDKWQKGYIPLRRLVTFAYGDMINLTVTTSKAQKTGVKEEIDRGKLRTLIPNIIHGTADKETIRRHLWKNLHSPMKMGSRFWMETMLIYQSLSGEPYRDGASYRLGRSFAIAEAALYKYEDFAGRRIRDTYWGEYLYHPRKVWEKRILPLISRYVTEDKRTHVLKRLINDTEAVLKSVGYDYSLKGDCVAGYNETRVKEKTL